MLWISPESEFCFITDVHSFGGERHRPVETALATLTEGDGAQGMDEAGGGLHQLEAALCTSRLYCNSLWARLLDLGMCCLFARRNKNCRG